MKQRILLTLLFVLTSVMSWGQWRDKDTFTDKNYPGLTFRIVSAENKSVRVDALDVTKTGTDVVIPGTVTGITDAGASTTFAVRYSGTGIYSGCTSVTLGENITTIDNGAFKGCPNLTQVNLPSTLTTWEDFQVHQVSTSGSTNMTTIKLAKFTLADGNNNFSLNTDGNALMSKDGTILYCILSNKLDGTTVTPLTTIDVPSTVEYFAGGGSRTFGHNSTGAASSGDKRSSGQVTTINLPASFKGVISSTGTTSTIMDASTFSIIHNSLTAINVASGNTVYANNNGDGILYTQDLTTLIALPGAKYYNAPCKIADEVTTIAANAAYHADEKSLDLNNVVSVGDNAFSLNNLLKTVTIGPKLTTLSSSTFASCTNLTGITVDSDNPKYAGDGVLYGPGETDEEIAAAASDETGTLKWKHLMTCPGKKSGTYTVNANAKIIDTKAFKGSALSEVIMSNIVEIGDSAFHNSKITTVNIPNTVIKVGISAFYECSQLTTATVGTGLTEISDHMFAATTALTSLTFTSTSQVTTIRQQAFGSTGLESITIPASVTSMETLVFQSANTKTVTFEDGSLLNSISGTFQQSKVETVDFGQDSHLVTIGASSFDGVTTLATINNFPETVETIGNRAFALCSGLTHFPFANGGKLKTIGINAFQGCAVTDFNLPEGLLTIGSEAFRECKSLKTLEIPSTVTSIGTLFTQSCDALTKINVSRSNAKYSSSDGILCSKDKETLWVFPGGKDRTSFTLLPPSIKTIKEYAFYGCTGLKYIVLPKKLETIENHAFECCDNLKTITFLGDAKPANVDAAVDEDNATAQTHKDAKDTTWQNYADHRFGNATTSAVEFLSTVTVNIRHASDTQNSFASSYWANAGTTVVSFDVKSGEKPDGNCFEYLFMSDDVLGIVKSTSTNYTAVVPESVIWPTTENVTNSDGTKTYGDGKSHPVRVIADYAFEDMQTSVNEVVFLGPIKYVGANAFNDGHKNGEQVTSPTSSIQNIFFTSNDDTDDNKMELSSVKFELNGMSLADETNNYDWGTENYAEFLKMGSYTTSNTKVTAKPVTVTKTQNVYVPKSRLAAVQTLWSNKADDGTASASATNAATVAAYKVPLPAISNTFGTISREFDVDLSDRTDNTQLLTIEDMPIVAFTGKVDDIKSNDKIVGVHMLSINCTKSGSVQTGQTNLGDGTYIPANTGVLLKCYAGTSDANAYYRIGEKSHDYDGVTFDTPETGYENVFQPVVENTLKINYQDGDYFNYLISGGGYKSVNSNSGNTMTVHKAYIHIASKISSAKAPALQFIWDDEDATGINNVKADAENGEKVIYDLSGRRVNNANAKGLYIVNGKKMMVK